MSEKEATYRKINAEYEKIRADQEEERRERVRAVYRKLPRVAEIDEEIRRAGFSNMRKIVENPQDAKKENQKFKQLLQVLGEEKSALLKKEGIAENFDRVWYVCEDCRDTGYIGRKKCHCYLQRLMNEAYLHSNLSDVLKGKEFEHFSLDYYSEQRMSDQTITERKNAENILKVCKHFCEQPQNGLDHLFLYGNPGGGKTFLSGCIANAYLRQQKTVLYTRATRLFGMYEDYRFGRNTTEELREMIDRVYDVDLLIIDDLGTENITRVTVSFLFDLLNERIDRKKSMIFNSNFTLPELSKAYSTRFTSRIYESFEVLELQASDIRIQKFAQSIEEKRRK